MKAMKPQEVARTWAEYLSAMMRHLTAAQTGDPEVAKTAEKRIADLIQEVLILMLILTLASGRQSLQYSWPLRANCGRGSLQDDVMAFTD